MTKALKITLLTGAGLLVIYAGLRLGFYLANREYFEGAPTGDILRAFLYGLRFDVAGLILLNLPVLLLFNLPLPTVKPAWYLRIVFVLFAALNTLGFAFNVVDFGYYSSVQRRTLFEPFRRPQDHLLNLASWAEAYPVLLFGGLAGLAILVYVMARLLRRLHRRIPDTPGWIRSHLCGALLLGLGVLGVRGGLQAGIMRPADAFVHSTSTAVGNMTLNSTYTVLLSSFLPRYRVIEKMPRGEALRIAVGMVKQDGEQLLDPRYPFLRQTAPDGEFRPLNVVILQMESWTFANVGPDEQGVSRTPFFDALTREGAYYTNFLSNAQRSAEAIPAVVASLPSLFRRPIIGSQAEMMHFRGLGDILDPLGYRVTFHYGASRTIEGFDGFTSLVGFHGYYSRADYRGDEPPEDRSDGKWGIYDELFFLDTARRLDQVEGPFAAMMFSLSPHDPYTLPANREAMFAAYKRSEAPYQVMMRYSDHALRRFFEYARTRPWFPRTIFFVTADHTRYAPPESFYGSFHVPLLIYAPGIVEPQVRPEIGSQVDILPTILDLLNVRTRHASLGRSLLDRTRTRYAVVQRGGRFVVFTDEWAYMHDLRREWGLFDYHRDPRFRTNLARAEPETAARLRTELFAYLQAVTTTVLHDRIWPK